MRKSRPNTLITNVSTAEPVEDIAVTRPLDRLRTPVVRCPINDERPGVEVTIRDIGGCATSHGFIAGTTSLLVAVDGTMADAISVNLLEDIKLTAQRPLCAVADGITQHPESRPHALLVRCGTHPQSSLNTEFLAIRRRPGLLCLDAAGGPLAIFLPGNELEGFATGELDIGVGGGVVLEFVVGVDVASDVPGFGVG